MYYLQWSGAQLITEDPLAEGYMRQLWADHNGEYRIMARIGCRHLDALSPPVAYPIPMPQIEEEVTREEAGEEVAGQEQKRFWKTWGGIAVIASIATLAYLLFF